jgi:hypothetical protein
VVDVTDGVATISDSLSASTGPVPSPPFYSGDATADVSYTVYPAYLDVGGTTPDSDGNLDILIGQQCSASIVGLPGGTGWTTTYLWSVSGSTLQSWTVSAINLQNPSQSQGTTTFVGGFGTSTNATLPKWFWYDQGKDSDTSETVSCTVTLTPPSGEGSPFTLNVSQPVNVYEPNWSCMGTSGTMEVNDNYGDDKVKTDYWLFAGPITGAGRGMTWNATLAAPSSIFSAGTIEMLQLITPGLEYTASKVAYVYSVNGDQGLDTSYPYNWIGTTPPYMSGDSPGVNLTALNATSASVNDVFDDYLMYTAPNSSQPVPLAFFTWHTNGSATLTDGETWATYSGSSGTVSPIGPPVNFTEDNTFPKWTQNSGDGVGAWEVPP